MSRKAEMKTDDEPDLKDSRLKREGESAQTRAAASWLLEFASGRKTEYIISVISALIGVACSVMPYIIMIDLIKELTEGSADASECIKECLFMGLWWVLRYIFHSVSTGVSHHATFFVLSDIRMRVMKKLSSMPLGSVLDKSSGTYKNIIVERIDSIETTLAHIVPEMTSNILGGIAVLVITFTVDWRMGLATLIVMPLGFLCFMTMMSGYEEKFKRTVDANKALNDTAVEYIGGIEVIKAFGQSKMSYAKFVSAAKENAASYIEWMRGTLFGFSAGMAVFPATLVGIIPVGCALYLSGTLSAGSFFTVLVLSFGIMQPLITAYSYTDDLTQMGTIVGEVVSVLNEDDLLRPDSADDIPSDNSIELRDVRFAYHEKEVLHGISLKIEPASVNALVGPSGSGKTTIARLIASFWEVDSGSILLGGVDLKRLPLKECADRIAFVSQDNYLFDMSVMDNIRMGKAGASDEDVISAAKACGCHDFIMGLERGYDTVCGSSGTHLSGGERQRISIARAMLKDAPIIILDEATSYTDPENEAVVQDAIARLIKGKTLLVIAHRLNTVSDADRIFVINDGNVEGTGTHEELLSTCPLYKKMWEAHIGAADGGRFSHD